MWPRNAAAKLRDPFRFVHVGRKEIGIDQLPKSVIDEVETGPTSCIVFRTPFPQCLRGGIDSPRLIDEGG